MDDCGSALMGLATSVLLSTVALVALIDSIADPGSPAARYAFVMALLTKPPESLLFFRKFLPCSIASCGFC